MLKTLLFVACAAACSSDQTPITELSKDQQIELCEEFRTELCTHPEYAAACTAGCWRTCEDAALGAIGNECAPDPGARPITADTVLACANSLDEDDCQEGGDCMILALESSCP